MSKKNALAYIRIRDGLKLVLVCVGLEGQYPVVWIEYYSPAEVDIQRPREELGEPAYSSAIHAEDDTYKLLKNRVGVAEATARDFGRRVDSALPTLQRLEFSTTQ